MDIQEKIENEILKIEWKNVKTIDDNVIEEVYKILCNFDKELIPLLKTMQMFSDFLPDNKIKSVMLYRILAFYGIVGDLPVLETRQKFYIKGKDMIKKTFLSETDRVYINTLLKDLGIL